MGLHVVLFEPRDHNNAGNIARTCVAFDATLHLIRPYGFIIPKAGFKRTAAGHWNEARIVEHLDIDDFFASLDPHKINEHYFYTRFGLRKPEDFDYDIVHKEIYLWFGREDIGLPEQLLKDYRYTTLRIPTSFAMRSINLANTVAIATFVVMAKNKFIGMCLEEPHKENPLKNAFKKRPKTN